jgi:hypothetical protein
LAANLWCWRPGIGSGRPNRPPSTEIDLYYGWPATYQAEWWRSDDGTLARRLLETAPFCHPGSEMELQARYRGALPALADITFAVAALFAVGVVVESEVRRCWPRWAIASLVLALGVMGVVLSAADRISEHV